MPWSPDPNALRGRVAVVAGATRGAGRGIAAALGEAGATVVCTGRTTRTATGQSRSDYQRSETIEETAELVSSLGGTGVAVAVDHLVPDEVKGLAQRIRTDHGHIEVLVNDIWGGELLNQWETPVWEHDLDKGLRLLRLGVETHLITSHSLLPLLVDRPGGLLVEVTDGTAEYNESHYRLNVFYDLAKVAVIRLAYSQGHELAPQGGTAVAITPGWLRSEMMLENFAVSEENWRESVDRPPDGDLPRAPAGFAVSESPRYVGRAVAALAADPERHRWNQRSVNSGQLAAEYAFTDIDGSQPQVWRYMEDTEHGGSADPAEYR